MTPSDECATLCSVGRTRAALTWLGLTEPSAAGVALANRAGVEPAGGAPGSRLTYLLDTALATGSTDLGAVSRSTALQVPAVAAARAVIVGTLAPLRLSEYGPTGAKVTDRSWLTYAPNAVTPWVELLTDTLDDLLFTDRAYWLALDRDRDGRPAAYQHLPAEQVTRHPDGSLEVPLSSHGSQRQTVPAESVITFRGPGPAGGLLTAGARTLATAYLLELAARRYARMETPASALVNTGPDLTDAEIDALLGSWQAARATGSTAYLNAAVRLETFAWSSRELQLVEARQQLTADVARLCGLDPASIGGPVGHSLTYATTEGNRRDLLELRLQRWLAPIEQRLTLDDVTRRGHAVRFDLGELLRADIPTRLELYRTGVELGAITSDEVRRLEPLYPDSTEAP